LVCYIQSIILNILQCDRIIIGEENPLHSASWVIVHAFSLLLPLVMSSVRNVILSMSGSTNRCIVHDLKNKKQQNIGKIPNATNEKEL
jgi:hypothetical protein